MNPNGPVAALDALLVVFRLGDALLILGLRVGQEIGLHAARPIGPPALGHRVHVDAHEQVALRFAERPAIGEVNEGVAGAGERRADTAPHQLRSQQAGDGECDVLLHQAIGEIPTRVPRIHASVPRVHYDRVMQAQSGHRVGHRRGRVHWGGWRRSGSHRTSHGQLDES